MNRTLIFSTLVALAGCGSEGSNNDYLGTDMPPIMTGNAGVGASGQGGAGTSLSGQGGFTGAAGAFVTGMSGSGGQPSMAGSSGMNGGGGQPATAGMMAGSGGMTAGGAGGAGGGASGAGGSSQGGAGGSAGPAMGTLTVSFTTVTYNGQYAPLNYGAVWFETASGDFIKTAKRWAGMTHQRDLVAWTEASGGWPGLFGGGNAEDMMDAMSSATIRTHQMHTVMWDMKNLQGQVVPDGDYVAVLEMSESRSATREGPLLRIPFTKGPAPHMAMPPDQEGFSGVSLSYQP